MMAYIRNHWRGNHPLYWSFWINLVGLRTIILYGERFTHPPFNDASPMAIALTVTYFIVFHLIVFPWQVVGVIRTCDRYLSELGSYMIVWLVQFGMVLSFLVTLVFVLGAFQSLFANPDALIINQKRPAPPILDEYVLSVSNDGQRIYMVGDFRIGITKEMTALLMANPEVKAVVLNSDGGRVTEGRGVARLIGKNRLDTYVFDTCKSACTTAFIGGATRYLGPAGKIGFHQFALDSRLKTPYIDPEEEQKIDLAFYAGQNIHQAFLDKVFQAAHGEIWFPSSDALLAAGVVHKVLPER